MSKNPLPHRNSILVLVSLILIIYSCGKEQDLSDSTFRYPNLPETPYEYANFDLPDHFDTNPLLNLVDYNGNNQVTNAGATLGRVLFYDVNLSNNRNTSCGSCHHQENGFADPFAGSKGHTGLLTPRNASHIVNLRYINRFFWDNRVTGLENQVLLPIQDALEMGMTLEDLVERIKKIPYYKPLFEDAFGDEEVTSEKISLALAQFVRSIVSYQTKYDDAITQNFSTFTKEEMLGFEIFTSNSTECNHCHLTANFFLNDALNTGLDTEYSDNGRGLITGNESDNGKFKVPSLRNVELTAPYMHDGRFATLEDALEHYSTGVSPHPNLDDRLTTDGEIGGNPRHLNFTPEEKNALIAFLKTLTDHTMVNDPKFADPFK
jgi:cytochrome c peroxidase